MDSRREFLKKALALAAGGHAAGAFPAAIQEALAIDPAPGSTFLDAEHVVILMQENRSFDHLYGSLRGVRGFDDPRAHTLPNGNPVWLQSNSKGETYAPFRLNIKDTKTTWMGCLPHSWTDQTAARNGGKYDRWLDTKKSGTREYSHLPLTLGFYNREDLPFYYSLADAFTVCDQNFCSSLTGTTPNRLHLWTGTVRAEQSPDSRPLVRNSDVEYGSWVNWRTFPELLEQHGISWRVYQNEMAVPTGLGGEEESWLSNFGDNPLEWFTQFHSRHHPGHRAWLRNQESKLAAELAELQAREKPDGAAVSRVERRLEQTRKAIAEFSEENFAKLPGREQSLHRRLCTVNSGDPHYRELETLVMDLDGVTREMKAPKGDIFHQFRKDAREGKLPTVSWMVAPQKFSDHPDSPWYGAWYIAEALSILTSNPEVWKKTIFILCYDENDGYFDHVPPFVPPAPDRPETGKTSPGVDTTLEHVTLAHEQEWRKKYPGGAITEGPVGLGYRVPLVIASPWSRGGFVCSEVFDHTSIIMLLEKILSHKTGREIRETNISPWRRTVCGDLTSAFRPWNGESMEFPLPVERNEYLAAIQRARFRDVPGNFHKFTEEEIRQARENPRATPLLPRQEPGTRPSCALPYELSAEGVPDADGQTFTLRLAAGNQRFGANAAGAPFRVYAPGKSRPAGKPDAAFEAGLSRDYAVAAGHAVTDQWRLEDFENGGLHLQVHGPNGFFREFRYRAGEPVAEIRLEEEKTLDGSVTGKPVVVLTNRTQQALTAVIEDASYGAAPETVELKPGGGTVRFIPKNAPGGWHDLRVLLQEAPGFQQRLAGRIETGKPSISDPAIGAA